MRDIKKRLKSLEKVRKRVLKSKRAAKTFLIKAGICDKEGKLKYPYNSLP